MDRRGTKLRDHPFIWTPIHLRRDPTTTRERIVEALRKKLEPLPFIDGFWESGAGADDRIDDRSDMGLYILTDAAKIDDAERAVVQALSEVSEIQGRH